MKNFQIITYDDFLKQIKEANCRASSAYWKPVSKYQTRKFTTTVNGIIGSKLYTCRHSDRERSTFLDWSDSSAKALLFCDLISSPKLMHVLKEESGSTANNAIENLRIVSLHCSSCDKRIVADGNHRLASASQQSPFISVEVVELSQEKWHPETPDFNVVCSCDRR